MQDVCKKGRSSAPFVYATRPCRARRAEQANENPLADDTFLDGLGLLATITRRNERVVPPKPIRVNAIVRVFGKARRRKGDGQAPRTLAEGAWPLRGPASVRGSSDDGAQKGRNVDGAELSAADKEFWRSQPEMKGIPQPKLS